MNDTPTTDHAIIDGALTEAMGRLGARPGCRPLNVGFVSLWFDRGQAYVTRALRGAIADRHRTFIFARAGLVHGHKIVESAGRWDVADLTTHPEYEIPPGVLVDWVRSNRLDVVVFNEEYDWELVRAVKETEARVVTYLDFYRHDWKPLLPIYDAILCSTRRTYEMVRDLGNTHYIGWGVDTELFRPSDGPAGNEPPAGPRHTFFHNAGWLGINYRKMTPTAILAFDAVSRVLPEVTLFIHAQVGPDRLPPETQRVLAANPRITYHVETVGPPGLYHRGQILLFPSKLEGLGLPLPEGLACGLPAIATNAPPMNEFVSHGENGLLVRVRETRIRPDQIAFPEALIDLGDLVRRMLELARDPLRVRRMAGRARQMVENRWSHEALSRRVSAVFDGLEANPTRSFLARVPRASRPDSHPPASI